MTILDYLASNEDYLSAYIREHGEIESDVSEGIMIGNSTGDVEGAWTDRLIQFKVDKYKVSLADIYGPGAPTEPPDSVWDRWDPSLY